MKGLPNLTERFHPEMAVATCQLCGDPFAHEHWKPQRFCSISCANRARRRPSVAERFWGKVDRSAGPDSCWPWLGARNAQGYGRVSVNRRNRQAHRVAFELAGGTLDRGQVACHRCDNPPCCNPTHVFAGTHGDNSADMVAKGRSTAGDRNPSRLYPERQVRGEQQHSAKLSDESVLALRQRWAMGGLTKRGLAREIGLSETALRRLLGGRTWAHVGGPLITDQGWIASKRGLLGQKK
jgi:hypothetical protein